MSWPLSTAINWRSLWENGESLLLVCPWRADDILARLQTLLYPVLHADETAWIVVPSERWLQLVTARLARYNHSVVCLGNQASAREATHALKRWDNYELDMVLMTSQWLPALLEQPAHLPLRLLGLDPSDLFAHHADTVHGLSDQLSGIPSVWLSPPLQKKNAIALQQAFCLTRLATVALNPFQTVITLHHPNRRNSLTPFQVGDRASYTQPVLWVSNEKAVPAQLPATAVSWDELPFLLQPGQCLIVPELPPTYHAWLGLCGSGLAVSIHLWLNPPAGSTANYYHYWQKRYPENRCAWQQTMQQWQGASTPDQKHAANSHFNIPAVPVWGQCAVCLAERTRKSAKTQ